MPEERRRPASQARLVRTLLGGLLAVIVVGAGLSGCETDNGHTLGSKTGRKGPTTSAPTAGPIAEPTAIPDRPNCAPKPSRCGLPDATNTGVPTGTKLTEVRGDLSVKTPGAVIAGRDIRGCIEIQAPNVTIRDSKITCTGAYGILVDDATGHLLIEDVEIDCQNSPTTAVGSYGMIARRMNIHNCGNGFDIDNTVTVTDSYIHDLWEGATGHADGIQLTAGAHITIVHNTIFDPGGTSAIISNQTGNSDVLVAQNLLAGGAYTLYCPFKSSSDFRVIGNRFSTLFNAKGGAYGPWTDCEKVAERSGNVWDSDLTPVAVE